MNSRLQTILISALLFLKVTPVLSQEINFNKLNLPEEISGTVITGITQDRKGNIWFSSGGNGLSQFDGIQYKSYVNESFNPASLSSNWVECVYADREGNIWAGTFGSGLEKFDPRTGGFTHFKHDKQDPSSISGDTVTAILQDRDGALWVGTLFSGLNRLDPNTGKFTHYRSDPNDPQSLSFDQVRVLYEDRQGVLWVGTGSNVTSEENSERKGGLNRFDKKTGTFTRYLHELNNEHSLIDSRVRALLEDSYGNFWVGTAGDGLHIMNRRNGSFQRHTYDPSDPGKLSRPPLINMFDWSEDNITFILEDAKKKIWIGTFGNGLTKYDPDTKKITRISKQKNPGSFQDSTSWWGFISREGVVWLSTWAGGVYNFDPLHKNFENHTVINNRIVFCFAEQAGNIQWFGTDSGLIRVDRNSNTTRVFRHDPKVPGSIADDNIFSLYVDRKNRLWAGSAGSIGGLNLYNPDNQTFINYKHIPGNNKSLSANPVFSIYEDKQANIWIGTLTGLDKMNVEKGEFLHYIPLAADTALGRNLVSSILEDSRQNLWVGNVNQGGLHLLDRNTGQFKNYLSRRSILNIHEDGFGKIWIGSEDGLYSYNNSVDSFSLFIDPASGLSISPNAMEEDKNKNLWLASPIGIFKINNERNTVTRFNKEFGINSGGLRGIKLLKTNDGQFYFGNGTGYYSILPELVSGNTNAPEIILTDLRVPGRKVKENLLTAKEIELGYDQNIFTFLFNVVHYTSPNSNKAIFMLENYDKGWRPAGSERAAYYFNVPPGIYTFRIKAVSSEGIWAEKSIRVIVTSPWWRSWFAYFMYALTIATTIFILNRILKQRLLSAERERNRTRELAQAREIEKAYNELKTTQSQLIQSEKMASLGELTAGIAHEIQNPLNFVNNFSEINQELLAEMKDAMDAGNMDEARYIANNVIENQEKINHHGKRADSIVKGMLQHSRETSGQKEATDLNKLVDEYVRLAYHGLRAKDKSFNATLQTAYDESIGKVNITSQEIGRVVLNLINNAFYAVDEKKNHQMNGYNPTVSIATKKMHDKVTISVKDNGNGVPQKVLDKIFQPFFTTKPAGQGTGLGLSLSYDIVKSHGGEIMVETKEGEGTEFKIQLPVV